MSENIYIPEELNQKPFSFSRWIKENLAGILGTVIFHMLILIIFLVVKIQSYKEIRDLSILMDFSEEPEEILQQEEEEMQEETEEEYFERLLEQELNRSNRAANISQNIEEEISTEKFVNEFMNELNESRTEEWLKRQEELQKMLENEDLVPVNEEEPSEEEEEPFTGPTNISYEFLEPPYDRSSLRLPVPVYKCRGSGIVEVEVSVTRTGTVSSAKARVKEASHDATCLAEVAEKYASRSIFRGSASAPANQKAKITYIFIAQ